MSREQYDVKGALAAGVSPQQIQAYLDKKYPKQQAPEKKKVGGLKGFLASAAPIIGGTLGMVGGTLLGGPVGTALGGAAGSGAGAFIKQKLLGEETNLGDIGKEAAFGAIPGGLGLASKGVKTARAALSGAKVATEAGEQAGKTVINAVAKPSMTSKIATGADRLAAEKNLGKVGKATGGGNRLMPEQSSDLYKAMQPGDVLHQYSGVKIGSGKPLEVAAKAEEAKNIIGKRIYDGFTNSKLAASPKDMDLIEQNIRKNLLADETLDPAARMHVADNFINSIKKSNGKLSSIWETKVKARDNVYKGNAVGANEATTSAARQSEAVGKALDDYIKSVVPEVEGINKAYSTASDVARLAAEASNSAAGFKFMGQEYGRQSIPGGIAKGASTIGKFLKGGKKAEAQVAPIAEQSAFGKLVEPTLEKAKPTGWRQFVKPAMQQTGVQAVGNAITAPIPEDAQADQSYEPITTAANDQLLSDAEAQGASQEAAALGPFEDPAKVQQAIMAALSSGDDKAAASIMEAYKMFGGGEGGGKDIKKTEGQRARDEAAALTDQAIQALDAGGVKTGIISSPLENLKAIGGMADQKTLDFNTITANLKATIAKARAGTAMSPGEKKMLEKYVPNDTDSGQQLRTKLAALQRTFQSAQEREYGTQYQADALTGTGL